MTRESEEQRQAPLPDVAELQAFRNRCTALIVATQADDWAEPSYIPYVEHEGRLLVFVSQLAPHTRRLCSSQRVGVLLLEDTSRAATPYARQRLFYRCGIRQLERGSDACEAGIDALEARHGKLLRTLRQLGDFRLLALTPEFGRFVRGFAQAYDLEGELLSLEPDNG